MKKAISLYHSQKKIAEKRNIDFLLTFDEWYQWWLSNGIDKNGPSQKELGIDRKNTLCMCRYGDIGPYSLDNIYCATASQNAKDMVTNGSMFRQCRKISTPQGIFDSITSWSKVVGKTAGAFASRRKNYPNDYKYLDYRANKPELN